MQLSDLNSGTVISTIVVDKSWLNPICNNLTCNNLTCNNLNVANATGTYNANIIVTGCINVADPQETHFIKINNVYTIYGFFRGDVQAVNRVTMTLNMVPGTTSILANRSFYLHSNRNLPGAIAFITSSDGNINPTTLILSCNTYNQTNAIPANQTGTEFFYQLTYISES